MILFNLCWRHLEGDATVMTCTDWSDVLACPYKYALKGYKKKGKTK